VGAGERGEEAEESDEDDEPAADEAGHGYESLALPI
jgi:hypothetical protein